MQIYSDSDVVVCQVVNAESHTGKDIFHTALFTAKGKVLPCSPLSPIERECPFAVDCPCNGCFTPLVLLYVPLC